MNNHQAQRKYKTAKPTATTKFIAVIATSVLLAFSVTTGCRQVQTTAYIATRRGLTSAEKQTLQAEIAKVNASNLSAAKKDASKGKIFAHYFKLAKQPKF